MAYFGYRRRASFCMWLCFVVLFVVGIIFWPWGVAGFVGCSLCTEGFANITYPISGGTLKADRNPDYYRDCRASRFRWILHEPTELVGDDPKGHFWWFCVNSGPLAMVIAGVIVFCASYVFLCVMCCLKPPQPDTQFTNPATAAVPTAEVALQPAAPPVPANPQYPTVEPMKA